MNRLLFTRYLISIPSRHGKCIIYRHSRALEHTHSDMILKLRPLLLWKSSSSRGANKSHDSCLHCLPVFDTLLDC